MSTEKCNKNTEKCNFSIYLNRALSLSGLKKNELAQKAGIREASISEFSRGLKSPSFSNIEKIAKAFDLTLGQFFSLDKTGEIKLVKPNTDLERELLIENRQLRIDLEQFRPVGEGTGVGSEEAHAEDNQSEAPAGKDLAV